MFASAPTAALALAQPEAAAAPQPEAGAVPQAVPERPVEQQKMVSHYQGKRNIRVSADTLTAPVGFVRFGEELIVLDQVTGEDPYGTGFDTWLQTSKGYVWAKDFVATEQPPVAAQQVKSSVQLVWPH